MWKPWRNVWNDAVLTAFLSIAVQIREAGEGHDSSLETGPTRAEGIRDLNSVPS